MKIVVCIRLGQDGEPGPFDACAYETALRIPEAEITLLSMGAPSFADRLLHLTRLGAKNAILLSDKAFAGADTLATAKTLAKALEKLSPDLVICGRQTLIGDTAQTGPMLSVLAGYSLITNVMSLDALTSTEITCSTRSEGQQTVPLPALVTVERINTLRLPRLRSRVGECEVWDAKTLELSPSECGLAASPTRVVKTFENQSGKRRCKKISREELSKVITLGLERYRARTAPETESCERLNHVCIVGDSPMEFARTVADHITVLNPTDEKTLAEEITKISPTAVLWGSDAWSKRTAAAVSAMLGLGLCADCTRLEADNGELMMYRPALSGSTIAKIRSTTKPAMATVRTAAEGHAPIVVGIGFGVRDEIERVKAFAEELGAEIATSRKMVDNGYLPYELQLGLTGKSLHPPVYIAVGISGAVHHIVGMQNAGTVIAINPDSDAPIFDYADFGIIDNF